MPGNVATLNGCCEILQGLTAGTVEPQLRVAVEIKPDKKRVSGENQRLGESCLMHLLHRLTDGREICVEVLIDNVCSGVGEPHVQVARGDQVHSGDGGGWRVPGCHGGDYMAAADEVG